MRKMLFTAIAAILALTILSSCGAAPANNGADQALTEDQTQVEDQTQEEAPPEDEPVTGVVTEMSEGTVEQHIDIQELPEVEGEELSNPYYKRELADDGSIVYTIMPADAEEPESLPASDTVIYSSESGDCYYEVVTYTYKLDGVPTEMTQYQLHVHS